MTIDHIFDHIWLTDGGLETTLIFHHGIDLPHFAAFDLYNKPHNLSVLDDYYRQYLELASRYRTGFILESATWRANPDWAYKLGYSDEELVRINNLAISQLQKLRQVYRDRIDHILISGCLGPRQDGYQVGTRMSAGEAREYHHLQINALKEAGVDLITALTINYAEEASGIVRAARENHLPVVISFTVETDGRLPGGTSLPEAIAFVDAASDQYPIYYMINCAHPSHFFSQLEQEGDWRQRLGGIRANASCKSHAELDEATELDRGDLAELVQWYGRLKSHYPKLSVFGGCCGTDASHLEAIGAVVAG